MRKLVVMLTVIVACATSSGETWAPPPWVVELSPEPSPEEQDRDVERSQERSQAPQAKSGATPQQKPIPGIPGGIAELRNGRWIRIK